jgi:hypothetical protein
VKQPLRQRIVAENDLASASPMLREAFWRSYNSRRRPEAVGLGELATELMDESLRGSNVSSDVLAEAWREVLPAEFATRTCVEGLSRGRLRVMVDSAATRFALSRRMGQALVDAINARLGRVVVRRIEYRMGSIETDQG